MTAGVSDVEPIAHSGDARVLDRGAVESLDARAQTRLASVPLEMEAVTAARQAKPAFVIRAGFRAAVKQQNLLARFVVEGGRIEDSQIFPRMIRVGTQDWITGKTY